MQQEDAINIRNKFYKYHKTKKMTLPHVLFTKGASECKADPPPHYAYREGDPIGWHTELVVAALDSWGELVPCDHIYSICDMMCNTHVLEIKM